MVTQPQFCVTATAPKFLRTRTIHGTQYRFVTAKKEHFFGFKKEWRSKTTQIFVSDIERTIIDGLRQPDYCGGLTEVAKGMWIKRDAINIPTALDYLLKISSGAVLRRFGFLCSLYDIVPSSILELLKQQLTPTYQLLDPSLPKEGKYVAEWRVQLNVTEEELLALTRT